MAVQPFALLSVLPVLIKLFWILAAGAVIVTILPVPVPHAFKDAVVLAAARGKLWQVKPNALGPLKDVSVPQSWFLHFYVIGSAFNLLLLLVYCAQYALRLEPMAAQLPMEPLVALAVFQLHLVRRMTETWLLMRYPPDAKMHVLAYVFGLSYYLLVPLSLLPEPAYQRLLHLCALSLAKLPELSERASRPGGLELLAQQMGARLDEGLQSFWRAAQPLQWLGLAAFLCANLLQHHSHVLLARLSRGNKEGDERGHYKLPRGGAFELVSCPHYLAEVLVYAGLMLMAASVRPMLALVLVWVGANLVLAAGATHKWYQQRFPHYPKQRRALVPFLY